MPSPTTQQEWNAAVQYHRAGNLRAAESLYRQILSRSPDLPEALQMLGVVAHQLGHQEEAVHLLGKAVTLRPNDARGHGNLGMVLAKLSRWEEAIRALRRAIALQPSLPEPYHNLASALRYTGRIGEAIGCLRRSLALRPDPHVESNLLNALHCHPDYGPEELFREHERWDQAHARPLFPASLTYANDKSPDRKLRIGYVAPQLGDSPAGRFLRPLLANHDRTRFQVLCYADYPPSDADSAFGRDFRDWRVTGGISDEQLASMVRHDEIDVLVDLAMHTDANRLLMFARKPAPVQVTWLAYCSTTGMRAMDYRLTDPFLDPPGSDQQWYSERSVWLPCTYWCYPPHQGISDVAPLPAIASGQVMFGCLNGFYKMSSICLQAWGQILASVPGSSLLMSAGAGTHRDAAVELIAQQGVDRNRVEFAPFLPLSRYFDLYSKIDFALDTFPYPGGTTTCDALWMGVPIVTLIGRTAVSRGGLSILSNIGLPELVARNVDQYVRIAVDLAKDLPRLANLRSGLRQRMRASPLMDAQAFARDVEAAYRQMWQAWSSR